MDIELVKVSDDCYFVRVKKYSTFKGDANYEYYDNSLKAWHCDWKNDTIINNEEEAQALYDKVKSYLNPVVIRKDKIYY